MITIKEHEPTTISHLDQLNDIVAAGFGYSESTGMLEDTERHIQVADIVQVAYDQDTPVALAMYKQRLWRPSH